ncbi:MAG: hypothetical protein H7Y28_14075 [Rhodoferax sp.]|nr:hypothetical protein [Rhodoferax sp.]
MWESVLLVAAAIAALLHGSPPSAPPGKRSATEVLALKPADFKSEVASAAGERMVFEKGLQTVAPQALPDPAHDTGLPAALEATALFNLDKNVTRQRLLAALPYLPQNLPDYQRQVLTGAHTLYWKEAAPLLPAVLPHIRTPREFAIGVYTVLRADDNPATRAQMRALLEASFPQWNGEPRLIALERRLRINPVQDLDARPPLVDLLMAPTRPGYPVVFSFQRKNRENRGMAMVRGADGRFVRNADGSYFNIAQLAMAKSRLPGTITNGNTPQGLFTIVGTVTAENQWIGPTPALESKVPKEASVADYEHAPALTTGTEWTEERYWSFFPDSWRGYAPMREVWLAGLAGRDEMWLHGNTVNPAYYRNEAHFPYAPSAGCMVAMEYWSKDSGTLVHSDQLALVKALASTGKMEGYLIVVEIDDRSVPVQVADVIADVMAAEARL